MQNKENVFVKKNTSYHLAPGGRGWHAVPGEGVYNKVSFMGTPSSPRWGTSPARGEVNGGFTLIELLVVVLIIGILTAVAVPQYQKAVEKSRLAEPLSFGNSFQKAVSVYLLENGLPTGDDRVKFVGPATGETTTKIPLSIDAEDTLDCTSTESTCVGKHFAYDGYCTSTECIFRAFRYFKSDFSDAKDGNNYYLRWRFRNNVYTTACIFYTDLGANICNSLKQQGWNISDKRP